MSVRPIPKPKVGQTHYCDFAPELVLDLALLDRIWSLLLDDLEELFDTHGGDFGQETTN
jgi:hypothetical protein